MLTPAKKECRFFYGDYHRGRSREECRLLYSADPPLTWKSDFCYTCPLPAILLANACPNITYIPELIRPFPYIKQQVRVKAYCKKTQQFVSEPKIGCGQCHPLPDIFIGDPSESDSSA